MVLKRLRFNLASATFGVEVVAFAARATFVADAFVTCSVGDFTVVFETVNSSFFFSIFSTDVLAFLLIAAEELCDVFCLLFDSVCFFDGVGGCASGFSDFTVSATLSVLEGELAIFATAGFTSIFFDSSDLTSLGVDSLGLGTASVFGSVVFGLPVFVTPELLFATAVTAGLTGVVGCLLPAIGVAAVTAALVFGGVASDARTLDGLTRCVTVADASTAGDAGDGFADGLVTFVTIRGTTNGGGVCTAANGSDVVVVVLIGFVFFRGVCFVRGDVGDNFCRPGTLGGTFS